MIPVNHLGYKRMQPYHLGATISRTHRNIEQFMESMNGFHGNPFPGKYVFVHPIDNQYSTSSLLKSNYVNLFERFGNYVQILELEIYDEDATCHLELCKNVLQYVSHLPNLTSLTIKGLLGRDADSQTRSFFERTANQRLFPELRILETFEWQLEYDYFIEQDANSQNCILETYKKVPILRKVGTKRNNPSVKTGSLGKHYMPI